MPTTKVWNISDHPGTDVQPCTVMILGRTIAPGRYAVIDTKRLETAHKLKADVERKLLYIGDKPPADYVSAKRPPKATIPDSVVRAHGPEPEKSEVPSPPVDPLAMPAPEPGTPKKKRKWG